MTGILGRREEDLRPARQADAGPTGRRNGPSGPRARAYAFLKCAAAALRGRLSAVRRQSGPAGQPLPPGQRQIPALLLLWAEGTCNAT